MSKAAKNPKGVTLTVYQRLRDAAVRGIGMNLSADDVIEFYRHDDFRESANDDDRVLGSKRAVAPEAA